MGKKNIPKKLLNLMVQREKTACKLLSLDAEVEVILTKLGIAETKEYIDYQCQYGVMVITEPAAYYNGVFEIIENTLNK